MLSLLTASGTSSCTRSDKRVTIQYPEEKAYLPPR